MKKLLSFILSACILLSSVNAVGAVDFSPSTDFSDKTEEINSVAETEGVFLPEKENSAVADDVDLLSFTDDFCQLVNHTADNGLEISDSAEVLYGAFGQAEYAEEDTNRLIVKSDKAVDTLDASAVALASSGKSGFKDNIYERAADTNRDEQIDADDYQAVVNKLVS